MPKLPALDGLRAAAILIVMLSHTGLGRIVPGGFGVTIFFFLSGYLITTLLRLEVANTGRVDLQRFYIKRGLRIIPPLYLTILLVAALSAMGVIDREIGAGGVLADLFFLTNYAPQLGAPAGVAMPLWSLDVEEHFYILFSTLFAFGLARWSSRRAGEVCLALALAALACRQAMAWGGDDLGQAYYWSHTRIDSILWGSLLAFWRNPIVDAEAWRPTTVHLVVALAILALCLQVRDPVFRETTRYTLQGGALFVVFAYALGHDGWTQRLLGSAPLRVVALLSYTLYLAHMPALAIAEHAHWPAPALSGIVIAFAYAGAMYWVVERPLARWRRRT